MRAIRIKIQNLCGFGGNALEAQLPAVAILSGDHGVGKSSIENVLKYALGRRPLAGSGSRGVEHDPNMLHLGADQGEAIIQFDDSSSIEYLRVVVKKDSTTRQIKTRGGTKWMAAAAEIDSFAEAISYDPMIIKTMPEKDRVAALLKIISVKVTREEIEAAAGVPVPLAPSLSAINSMYAGIEAERRDVNRDIKSLTAHASELESALPPEAAGGTDWAAVEADCLKQISAIRLDWASREKLENQHLLDAREKAQAEERSIFSAIDIEINNKIAALEKERRERYSVISANTQSKIDAARKISDSAVNDLRKELTPQIESLTATAAEARTHAEAQSRAAGARESARRAREAAAAKEAQSAKMTEALGRLSALKQEVAGRMNIPGVVIESPADGMEVDVCRSENGVLVPFSAWNDSAKDLLCLRVAVLSRGTCGLVCVDSLGEYTPQRRDAVLEAARKYAAEYGMQFVFGEATREGDPLKVVDATEKG